jgi:hypothetical protein
MAGSLGMTDDGIGWASVVMRGTNAGTEDSFGIDSSTSCTIDTSGGGTSADVTLATGTFGKGWVTSSAGDWTIAAAADSFGAGDSPPSCTTDSSAVETSCRATIR